MYFNVLSSNIKQHMCVLQRVYKGTLPTYEWGPVAVVLEYMHMAEEGIPETELRGVTNPIMQVSKRNK